METLLENEKKAFPIKAEALEAELKKINVKPDDLRADGTFDELLNGRKTSQLVVARFIK